MLCRYTCSGSTVGNVDLAIGARRAAAPSEPRDLDGRGTSGYLRQQSERRSRAADPRPGAAADRTSAIPALAICPGSPLRPCLPSFAGRRGALAPGRRARRLGAGTGCEADCSSRWQPLSNATRHTATSARDSSSSYDPKYTADHNSRPPCRSQLERRLEHRGELIFERAVVLLPIARLGKPGKGSSEMPGRASGAPARRSSGSCAARATARSAPTRADRRGGIARSLSANRSIPCASPAALPASSIHRSWIAGPVTQSSRSTKCGPRSVQRILPRWQSPKMRPCAAPHQPNARSSTASRQRVGEIGVLGRQVVRHPLALEHENRATCAPDPRHSRRTRSWNWPARPTRVNAAEKTPDPFPLLGSAELRPAPAASRKDGVAKPAVQMQRLPVGR